MDDKKDLIIQVLNCFETGRAKTDYSSIFLYRDGPNNTKQVTLGRGYTEAGSLWTVFERYRDLGGLYAGKLLSYRNEKGKQTLPANQDFLRTIVQLGKNDPLFRQAQDLVYDEIYWNKGFVYFKANGFTENLSLLVIQDSYLHSGSILPFLTKRFPEKKPNDGGHERLWIEAYVKARNSWLANHSNKILRNTTYRTEMFLREIAKDNWNLNTPFVANDVKFA